MNELDSTFNKHEEDKKRLASIWEDWRNDRSEQKTGIIFKELEPTINAALTSFGGGDQTLKTRAYILAKESMETFNPEMGTSLKSHVYNNLKRLYRYKAERSEVVHVPENTRLDGIHLHKFKQEFTDKHNREPSIAEISDGLKLSKSKIKKANLFGKEMASNAFTTESGDTHLSKKRDEQEIWRDYVYHDLDPINQKIFEYTTGYGGSEVLAKRDIALKLKISPSAISQRINTIVKKLQEGV